MLQHTFAFGDFERYMYEELKLKHKLSQENKVPFNEKRFIGNFY